MSSVLLVVGVVSIINHRIAPPNSTPRFTNEKAPIEGLSS